ncbi:hypothetical protein BV25DRAFT_1911043 [Artomyces pyxidatus]|uniref:Uncharacterized protein n=1 Tax=Artomyces pyxidatus TaxID=48021 RepID=A0ACB8THU0_9AGAM|nr:hypothetical protein BV25DRAFT_1911043 [Artomyces pyxidatus]
MSHLSAQSDTHAPSPKRSFSAVEHTDSSCNPSSNPLKIHQGSAYQHPQYAPAPQNEAALAFGPPQRRRVNPESLAARLGPELVAEMEKYIIPGNIEMPSFNIRRDIQVKFGADRRHIYDFFHSRGLRCLKDEKSVRRETVFQETRPRIARTVVPPPSPKAPEFKKRRVAATAAAASLVKPIRGPRKNKIHRKRMSNEAECTPLNYHGHTFPTPDYSELTEEDLSSNFIPPTNPLDGDFSLERAVGEVSHSYRERPLFERMAELEGSLQYSSSIPTSDKSWSMTSISSLASSPDLMDSSSVSSINTCCSALKTPKLDIGLPSRSEREEHYAWLADIFGPAAGIQESVGSYKSYMNQQRDLYFERLLQGDARRQLTAPVRSPATSEFQAWTRCAKQVQIPSVSEKQEPASALLPPSPSLGSTSDDTLSDVLDAMFPCLELVYPDDMASPDSPVLRSSSESLIPVSEGCNLSVIADVLVYNASLEQVKASHDPSKMPDLQLLPSCQARNCGPSPRIKEVAGSFYADMEWARMRLRTFSAAGEL